MCDFNRESKVDIIPCGRCSGSGLHTCGKCEGLGFLDPHHMRDVVFAGKVQAFIQKHGVHPGCTNCGGKVREGSVGRGVVSCMCDNGTQKFYYTKAGGHWYAGCDGVCIYCRQSKE